MCIQNTIAQADVQDIMVYWEAKKKQGKYAPNAIVLKANKTYFCTSEPKSSGDRQ